MKRVNGAKGILFHAVLLVAIVVFTTGTAMFSMNRMAADNRRDLDLLLAARVYDSLNSSLTEPIMAAQTMANSTFIKDFLDGGEEAVSFEEGVKIMEEYLSSLRKGLNYDTFFLVSDITKRYYTDNGLNKIVDPINDPHDEWYSLFSELNRPYDLDVDADEVHGNRWTVFVNTRIEKDGRYLGACGAGVQMTNLQELILQYEEEYNVKINLVDEEGLVQVDTQESSIENSYIEDVSLSRKDGAEYVYEKKAGGKATVYKYVDKLDWYLVVQSEEFFFRENGSFLIAVNGILFAMLIVFLTIFSRAAHRRTKVFIAASYRDEVTGLPNRRAYQENIDRLGEKPLASDLVLVYADVNGLKGINDNIGHQAGDEIISASAACLEKGLGAYGKIYRIGGDEFAAVLNIPLGDYDSVREKLRKIIDSWEGKLVKKLSVSIGFMPRWEGEDLSLKELLQAADRRMYSSKSTYYAQKGVDRRKRNRVEDNEANKSDISRTED